MKPEQFIREFGVEKAREVVAASANALVQCNDGTTFHVNDLKRLVESLDIINELGSLRSAKANVREMYVDSSCDYVHPEAALYDYKHLEIGRVMKAIRDHESVYGGRNE